ncbi:MAG: hypothetical protein ACLSGX_00575 [Pseudoruminococcus massiliensis]|jgi:hypothetical protein|uniref:hypothetical protein n=1 Tax=Pseudoruminococcus massiliensis TaxID=2086583 RepID=UPI0039930FE1|nr:hypothetical protein [Oscillospiraceae bacterium]
MTDEKRSRIKELEEMLSYLVNDSMTLEEKLKSLSDAYWEASHSGYGYEELRAMGYSDYEARRLIREANGKISPV